MGYACPKRRLSALFTVVDDSDSSEIEGATIEITDTGEIKDTDENGEAEFELLPGTYDYNVNADNYVEETGNFELTVEDITVAIEMTAE